MADDLKEHALSTHDYYELLGILDTATEKEIRSAYRRTSVKYHPDKVPHLRDTFDLLTIARDVLLDATARQLYDNARRARNEKKERDAARDGESRRFADDLERRERAGDKRKRTQEEDAHERELKRLAADGARRRAELEERMRKARMEQEEPEPAVVDASDVTDTKSTSTAEIDRTISLRFLASDGLDQDELTQRFSRFGKIDSVVLKNKEKKGKQYVFALIVYQSIVGAHAAVVDLPGLQSKEPQTWSIFGNSVKWASGREPDYIPKPGSAMKAKEAPTDASYNTPLKTHTAKLKEDGPGLRKVPSFGSFKGTPKRAVDSPGGPSTEEMMRMRLKNAERQRLARKLQEEDAQAEA